MLRVGVVVVEAVVTVEAWRPSFSLSYYNRGEMGAGVTLVVLRRGLTRKEKIPLSNPLPRSIRRTIPLSGPNISGLSSQGLNLLQGNIMRIPHSYVQSQGKV